MYKLLTRFIRQEAGVTSIEYALIATFICLAIITSVTQVGNNLSPVFNNVAANL